MAFVESVIATLSIIAAGRNKAALSGILDFFLITMSTYVVMLIAEGSVPVWGAPLYGASFGFGTYCGVKYYPKLERLWR